MRGVEIKRIRNVRISILEVASIILKMAVEALPKSNPGLFSRSPIEEITTPFVNRKFRNLVKKSLLAPMFIVDPSLFAFIAKVKDPEVKNELN